MPAEPPSLKELFLAVLAVPPKERTAWLEKKCGQDAQMRRRVEMMLTAHEKPQSLLDCLAPVAALPEAATADLAGPESEQAGTVIGPYKLIQQIGEGGMGTVYMAQQTEPVKRAVALKIIKAGMDTRQVIARFEAERQALALMDHPNIAKVLDAGATGGEPGGVSPARPFFVMELVKGVSMTKYCDEHRLTPRQRLELFIPVCQAVQHAHQKGIIHRDLKPSNILIAQYDGRPVPKVIDFGVAKAAGQQLTDKTLMTGFGSLIGTLEYMSPEQAEINQLDVDTRSDIYSLGVVLYELLTGSTPLDRKRLNQMAFTEMLRIIREEEPPKPSTRLSDSTDSLPSISAQRQMEPTKLTRIVRGDLDWIVMKALEKDRNRRYQTANGFAADVTHYLNDEPVTACPPSSWYRFRKFTRRHKVGLRIAVAATLVLLIAVGGVSLAVWDQATRRAEQSERMVETEQTVTAALIETKSWSLHAAEAPSATSQDAEAALTLWVKAEAALTQAETALKTGTADDRLRQRVLDVRHQIEQGRTQARRTANLLHDLDEARMTRSIWISTHFDYAGEARKYEAAFAAYGLEVKPGRTEELARHIRAEQPAIREALIVALDNWQDTAARAKATEQANLVMEIAATADDDPWRRQYREAAAGSDATTLRALSSNARRLSLPPSSLRLLATSLSSHGARDEALALLRWARAAYHTDFWIPFELGSLLEQGKDKSPVILEEAIGCLRTALALRPAASAAHNNLGNCLRSRKQLDEAIAEYRLAIDIDPKNAAAHNNLGGALGDKNHWDDAIAELRLAIEFDPRHALTHYNLGAALYHKNQLDAAIAELRLAIDLDPKYALAHNNLGLALYGKNQLDAAIAEYGKAIDLDPKDAVPHSNLGNAFLAKNQVDKAVTAFRRAIELDPNYAVAHYNLGLALHIKNQLDAALAEYRQAVDLDPMLARAHYGVGTILTRRNQLDAASDQFRQAIDLQPDYAEAYCDLAGILGFQGHLSASLDLYKRGHALGSKRKDWPNPSEQWVADAERLVRLEAKLSDVLAGKATPTDNRELLGLLQVCRLQHRHAAACRLYADAFTANAKLADDLEANHRYNGACFAALAAEGQGTDADKLDEQEQSRLRQQALAWLRADLDQWTKRLEGGKPADRQVVRAKLEHWQRDTDLAGVRDADALKKLSSEQQEAWRKLWADVAELIKKAGNAK